MKTFYEFLFSEATPPPATPKDSGGKSGPAPSGKPSSLPSGFGSGMPPGLGGPPMGLGGPPIGGVGGIGALGGPSPSLGGGPSPDGQQAPPGPKIQKIDSDDVWGLLKKDLEGPKKKESRQKADHSL